MKRLQLIGFAVCLPVVLAANLEAGHRYRGSNACVDTYSPPCAPPCNHGCRSSCVDDCPQKDLPSRDVPQRDVVYEKTFMEPQTVMMPQVQMVPVTVLRPRTVLLRRDGVSVNRDLRVTGFEDVRRDFDIEERDIAQRDLDSIDIDNRLRALEDKVSIIERKLSALCETN